MITRIQEQDVNDERLPQNAHSNNTVEHVYRFAKTTMYSFPQLYADNTNPKIGYSLKKLPIASKTTKRHRFRSNKCKIAIKKRFLTKRI